MQAPSDPYIVEIAGVTKRFPGVLALDRISIGFRAGEVHAVIGENGAGKSTLMNILAGDLQPDEGKLRLDGKTIRFASPLDSRAAGIVVVYQELALCPTLSVAENIMMSDMAARPVVSLVPRGRMRTRSPRGPRQARHGQSRPRRQSGPAQDRRDATGRDRGRGATTRPSARARRAELGAFQARKRAPVRTGQAAARRGRHRHLRVAPPPGGARSRRSHHGRARWPHRRDARKRQYSGRSPDTRHGRSATWAARSHGSSTPIRKTPTSCWR